MSSFEAIPAPTVQQTGIDKICADLDKQVVVATDVKPRNKDLKKTKMCVYHLQGKCGYGGSCQFAHCISEIQEVPNLAKTQLCSNFMNGTCIEKKCTYAHGKAELVMPPSFKKKVCAWYMQGKCRNGTNCGFAHEISELRTEAPPGIHFNEFSKKIPEQIYIPPPGLSMIGSEDGYESSTDAPSSQGQSESDSCMVTELRPDSLQQQVSSMGSAIEGLQAKLSQIENMAAHAQIVQMQETINQLTKQCSDMESRVGKTKQSASPLAPPPWRKACANAPKMSFKPFQ